MDGRICVFSCNCGVQLKKKQIGHQKQKNYYIKTELFCQNTFLILSAGNTEAKLIISALDCSIASTKYIVLSTKYIVLSTKYIVLSTKYIVHACFIKIKLKI